MGSETVKAGLRMPGRFLVDWSPNESIGDRGTASHPSLGHCESQIEPPINSIGGWGQVEPLLKGGIFASLEVAQDTASG